MPAASGWLLEPSFEQQLLLITCYPFDAPLPGTERRYVVTADVSPPAADPAPYL
jgi:hypothetical protein